MIEIDFIVTHADMRKTYYCNRHAREWAARHGLDWWDFLQHGVPASVLLAMGDALADEVVETARRRIADESGISRG
jgi:hypothetical protein